MDTTSEAAAIQTETLRRLTGSERLRIAVRMSDAARELALARLRTEHPPVVSQDPVRGSCMTPEDVFHRVIQALERAGIPYMLTGSFASSYHGVPRASQDIDIVVAPTEQQIETNCTS